MKLHGHLHLPTEFQVSSTNLTNFRQRKGVVRGGGVFFPPPPQNEPLKSPPRLGLNDFECLSLLVVNRIESWLFR